jgi:hypothetical protein
MNRNSILLILAVVLVVIGAYMIYLGSLSGLVPPKLTGVGFIIIAIAFVVLRNK